MIDVENMISQGANALIILTHDDSTTEPIISKAMADGVPIVDYDRQIESDDACYLTFDNREVGRMLANGVFIIKPEGHCIFIEYSVSIQALASCSSVDRSAEGSRLC